MQIAIDGPSGAGKSTVARACAKTLGIIYIDTGALYRAIALFALRGGLADITTALAGITIDVVPGANGEEQRVILCGKDVTGEIRTDDVAMKASEVSALPAVREFLLGLQRRLAESDCVMDGRDVGSVVLPRADVKIYLDASPRERARRRHKELSEKGVVTNFDEVLTQIEKRDYDDTHRDIAPLTRCDDAVYVITDGLDFEQVVAKLLDVVQAKGK